MSDAEKNFNVAEHRHDLRLRVLAISSVFAVIYSVWFGVDNTLIGNSRLAVVNFIVAVIFLATCLGSLGSFIGKRYRWPIPVAVITACLFFFLLYFTGGNDSSGALWSFIIPLNVFFLLGFKPGIVVSLTYLALCAATVTLGFYYPDVAHLYSTAFLKRFFGIFSLLAVVSAGYEYHKAQNEKSLFQLLNLAEQSKSQIGLSELKYRALFDGGGHGIVIVDIHSERVLEVNPSAALMFGYEKNEFKGLPIERLHPADEFVEIMHKFRKNTGVPFNNIKQLVCRRNDRSIFYADLYTALLELEGRNCVVNFFADVTRRVLAERELITARKKADTASDAKTAFLANMSHEIRTPIHGIYSVIELLMQSKLSDEQMQYAEIIREGSNSLLSLINEILDISKIEAGKLELDQVSFDLKGLVKSIFEQMHQKALSKDLAYELILSDDLPKIVCGDPAKLRQILANLIDNAIKFTNEGRVLLSVTPDSGAEKYSVIFEVVDSGIGIANDQLELVFKSFVQLDTSPNKRFTGTGLGLAISKKLALLMGGDIFVKSELGRGSRFWVSIPLIREDGDPELESRYRKVLSDSGNVIAVAADNLMLRNYYALLAEDNPVNQFVVKSMLDKFGIPVDVVANGHEAILALAKRKYDILLLDLQMPLLDGYETIRLIRENTSANFDRSIPAIAVTADAFPETREACIKAGMNDCLIKPFRMHDLNNIIKKWLPQKANKP